MDSANQSKNTVAIHSPNWLGDVVMFLPAWRAWRDAHPGAHVAIVAKKRVAAIWRLVRDVNELIVLEDGHAGMQKARRELRSLGAFDGICAPASFRSAWLMRSAGAKTIRGVGGQFRFLLIDNKVSLKGLEAAHQSIEYARIMGVEETKLPPPSAALNLNGLPDVATPCDASEALVVLPGAARGGSKRWPPEHFAEVAARAVETGLALCVLVCGTQGERMECDAVEAALGGLGIRTFNLCGKTSLPELTAILARSKAALSNDSGGMHLATAAGTPVVAVFGLTDARKTGPLGIARAVSAEGVKHSRAIPRESAAAAAALRSVSPDRVFSELENLLSP